MYIDNVHHRYSDLISKNTYSWNFANSCRIFIAKNRCYLWRMASGRESWVTYWRFFHLARVWIHLTRKQGMFYWVVYRRSCLDLKFSGYSDRLIFKIIKIASVSTAVIFSFQFSISQVLTSQSSSLTEFPHFTFCIWLIT